MKVEKITLVEVSASKKLKLGMIIFGSVRFLSKKSNQIEFKKKQTETDSNRPVSVSFLG
jgi:hypothetical protein